mmetsp:Transcript_134534/g.335677  ORF Transcript_134534/g.335677 Transcript_134534/m.335677 type:complete len:81 (+) Transcript_134534:218-460(+)
MGGPKGVLLTSMVGTPQWSPPLPPRRPSNVEHGSSAMMGSVSWVGSAVLSVSRSLPADADCAFNAMAAAASGFTRRAAKA